MRTIKGSFRNLLFIFSLVMCFVGMFPEAKGQQVIAALQDRDGNAYRTSLLKDRRKWMTDNLKVAISGSFCYENTSQNCDQYGRLYTWKSAQEGCKLLGDGWRLPTNEEWQRMVKWYGGVRDDSDDGGKVAYEELVNGGKSGFNVVFGGRGDSAGVSFARQGAHGFYWTATESDPGHAWFYNLGKKMEK